MPIEDIASLNEKFDVVISSLAFHYIEDFFGVVRTVYDKLSENGTFVFSQENPLCTCHCGENRWTKDEAGNKLYLNLSNCGIEGERESTWFIDIVNTLIDVGFTIKKCLSHYLQMKYLLNIQNIRAYTINQIFC